MSMSKIDTDLHPDVLSALAEGCGFRVSYDRTPGADAWTLSSGHGADHVQYAGTRQSTCAFLAGYAAMRVRARALLGELEEAHRRLVATARHSLGS